MPTAEQILYVLNDCEPINVANLWFCVITAGSQYYIDTRGGVHQSREPDYRGYRPGELLVVGDEYGREPFGGGRKPSKVDLTEFYTQDFAAAKALSELIQDKPKPRKGWWQWDGAAWTRPDDQRAALEQWHADSGGVRTSVGISPGEYWPPRKDAQ